MRRHRGRDPFRVGLVVLVVLGVVTSLGVTRTNPFHRGYKIHAIFASALSNGLHPGSPVRIAGVNVGKVTAVSRGPGRTADVTMEITDAGRPVHTDAIAKARPRIFLEGNFFVQLEPGTSRAPELRDGGTLPLTQTALPVQIDQFVDVFDSDTRQSQRDLLRGFADALDKGGAAALRQTYRQAPGALKEGAVALQALRGTRDGDLRGWIAGQAHVADTLDAHRTELSSLLSGFRQTMDALAAEQSSLSATVPALARLTQDAPAALADVRAALPPLRRFAVALRPGLDVAPGVLRHAVPFLGALDGLLAPAQLPRVVDELRRTVSGLRTLEQRLPGLFDLVDPVSTCVTDKVLPVVTQEVPDGHLSTGQPAWQDLLHGLLGLASAQQNFSGDGYSTRFSFGLDQTVVATNLNVPDKLVMLGNSPLLGARPRWTPGSQPPFRPDVPCETQPVQRDLTADTVPAPTATKTIRLRPAKAWSRTQLLGALRRSLEAAGKVKP